MVVFEVHLRGQGGVTQRSCVATTFWRAQQRHTSEFGNKTAPSSYPCCERSNGQEFIIPTTLRKCGVPYANADVVRSSVLNALRQREKGYLKQFNEFWMLTSKILCQYSGHIRPSGTTQWFKPCILTTPLNVAHEGHYPTTTF